ncbi:MAG: DUF4406 domain-containing protein [Bacteroidales bacterium]|nr:DUF4406 domain-containing protein [Bacteroidales bacterium]
MVRKKIYIAGPVSGNDYNNALMQFNAAEAAIYALHGYADVKVVNPMRLCRGLTRWSECMRRCIGELVTCDFIHLLPGGEQSRGARLEFTIATELGLGLCNEKYILLNPDGTICQ